MIVKARLKCSKKNKMWYYGKKQLEAFTKTCNSIMIKNHLRRFINYEKWKSCEVMSYWSYVFKANMFLSVKNVRKLLTSTNDPIYAWNSKLNDKLYVQNPTLPNPLSMSFKPNCRKCLLVSNLPLIKDYSRYEISSIF